MSPMTINKKKARQYSLGPFIFYFFLANIVIKIVQQGTRLDLIAYLFIVILFGALMWLSEHQKKKIIIGGIYSTKDEDGYGICKVLDAYDEVVHMCIYENTFQKRPTHVDPKELKVGAVNMEAILKGEKWKLSIMHIPMSKEGFYKMEPLLIMKTFLKADELEGYNSWLASMLEKALEKQTREKLTPPPPPPLLISSGPFRM